MKNYQTWKHLGGAAFVLILAALLPSISGWSVAQAAATDVSPAPIFTAATATTEVKPNVMFVLDDSGSMNWDYMPDKADDFSGKYGFASSHCNGVYYNPAITYAPPVYASGSSYADASFTSAKKDGYGTGSGVNLSTSFKANNSDTGQAAYYYVYSGTQTTEKQKDYYNTGGIFYKECNSNIGSTTKVDGTNQVNNIFTKVIVSATSGPGSTDERTNFANWYSFYRTRMLMMKTASGQAFKTLNNHFRVGFMSINNNDSPAILNIADFDSTQKASWYSRLYDSTPGSSTPLREALSNAGRIYAGQLTSLGGDTVKDPVQYSCQQNYTILSTDGFWNGGDGLKLDGSTTMDNQDGLLARPYNDGAVATSTTVTPYVSTEDRKKVTTGVTTTTIWTKSTSVIGASCSTAGSTAPPANTTAAPMEIRSDGRQGELRKSDGNPWPSNPGRCINLTNAATNNAWFCRTGLSPAGSSSVTDGTGKKWYLVSSGAGATGCTSASVAFGGGTYDTAAGVCPATTVAGVTGKLVTTTPYTQTVTTSGSTSTVIDRYTATQTRTQTVTNGVAGALGPLTPTTPVYSFTSNISTASTPDTSTTTGLPVAGTPSPNNTCVATALVPAEGTTTPTITSTSATSGTTVNSIAASSGPTAGTPTVTGGTAGGTSNTLSDVAAYYYNTNLRTSLLGNCTGPIIAPATTPTNLCLANKVPANGLDTATHQHMTTFTLGLGARGRMVFSSTYLTDSSGDYFDVYNGNTKGSTNCTWADTLTVSGGPCNWPVPGSDKIENIDDLWHAAINGHGNYFSATDPNTLRNALASSLNVIINTPQPGTAASAATTNPKITSTNNFQFSSYFKSVEWSGELIRQKMSLTDGSVPAYDHMHPNAAAYDWSAQTLLDAKTYSTRNIYTKGTISGTTGLINFDWATLGSATLDSVNLQSYFKTPNISTSPPAFPTQLTGLSQFCSVGTDCLSTTARGNFTIATGGAAGEALVNFLRGDRSNEEGIVTDPAKFYRHRASVLGDIVSAQPIYVGPPSKGYDEALNPGYANFKTTQSSRAANIYAAANDGMLHAFDAATGEEKWAYIPSFVLPRIYTLADKKYADKHQYFVEGTPKSGDVYIGGAWKTILVGGLNGGGTGYYALDITNATAPTLLWEFTDANMGYSFGSPEITKLDDGTWVVLLTSGYDNCPSSTLNCAKNGVGDGQGHLYVINAATGALVTSSTDIATGAGDATTPSGLAKIIAHSPTGSVNNVTTRVYGGDLLGNLWRFTIGSGGYSKQRLATFKDSLGNVQPITARPQVTTHNGKPIVYVGTGRYLGTSDVGNMQQQSFYAIKDMLDATDHGNPRADTTNFLRKTAVDGTCPTGTPIDICDTGTKIRTVTENVGVASDSITNKRGWIVDFPASSGEIAFTDPKLVLGTLNFSTSVPTATTSEVCGSSTSQDPVAMAYMLNYLTGGAVGTTSIIGTTLGVGVSTAPQISQLPNGTVIAKYRLSDGHEESEKVRFGNAGNATERISWRELIGE